LASWCRTPTVPGPADTCCPAGSDLGDDPDCPPSCGDGVITPPETCDDNNDNAGDGCSAICRIEPVGFRFTDLDIRDPHLFATVPILNCTDVTNLSLFGIDGVNPMLQTSIQTDATDDDDTFLDLSIVNTFAPLVQTASSTTLADLTFPDCTAPMSSTSCTLAAGEPHTTATATNAGSGTCLGTVPNTTTSGYTPALVLASAPTGGTCYSANAGTVTFMLGDLPITLVDAQIGGAWFGNPATEIKNGMIRGFLTEATANATIIIPEGLTGIDSIDGSPLSSLLPGGTNNCSKPGPANVGDMDTLAGTTTKGWYFYLNFSAARVSYVEQ
jgi:cysteine-rich repeat protein